MRLPDRNSFLKIKNKKFKEKGEAVTYYICSNVSASTVGNERIHNENQIWQYNSSTYMYDEVSEIIS